MEYKMISIESFQEIQNFIVFVWAVQRKPLNWLFKKFIYFPDIVGISLIPGFYYFVIKSLGPKNNYTLNKCLNISHFI